MLIVHNQLQIMSVAMHAYVMQDMSCFQQSGIKHKCKKCVAGRFKGEVGEDACAECGPGSYSAVDGATNCTLSPSGYRPNALVEATGIINCNSGTSDKYAPEGSSECKTCPVPLEILQGSEAASIDDCVCPAGYYKQRREDGTFKDCISCQAVQSASRVPKTLRTYKENLDSGGLQQQLLNSGLAMSQRRKSQTPNGISG